MLKVASLLVMALVAYLGYGFIPRDVQYSVKLTVNQTFHALAR